MLIPIGGGGLAAGIATALRAVKPDVRIVGVQAGKSGFTIADGIFVKYPGELTMGILDSLLDDIVHVVDEEITEAIVLLLERSKLVVEGAGAVGVAALLAGKAGGGDGPAVAVLSGGNIDPTLLISVMRHGLTVAGRYLVVRTRIPDRPGELIKLLQLCAEKRVNVVSVEHHREGMHISVAETEVELTVGTRDLEHGNEVIAAFDDARVSDRTRALMRRERKVVTVSVRRPRRLHRALGIARPGGRRGDPAPVPRAAARRARAARRHGGEVRRRRGDGGVRRAGRARGRSRARGSRGAGDPRRDRRRRQARGARRA